ncbi:MAG: hypothetical protein J3K34DRAFT_525930 [Monoraphidium minutum]|nr:MAG: hypothetical protein J3K34DRAFT_525930 [Monoraphidium minutum]
MAAAAAAARPSAAGAAKKSEESVCVAVHIRPLIDIELDQGCQECLFVTPGSGQITTSGNIQSFTYDHVFGGDCGEDLPHLYPKCVAPLLDGLFKGYNATVFAYGQTGSGKTFTMGSGFAPGGPCRGVIPEVMEELFARVEAGKEGAEFSVRASFVEIHKEEVRDLLFVEGRVPRPQVTIRELPGGVTLAGAVEREVRSREEMACVLEQGSLCRAVGATNMNNRSSRSHAIFTITLEQRRAEPAAPSASRPASPARRAAAAAAGDAAAAAALVAEAAEDEEEEEDDDGEDGGDGGGEDGGDDYLCAKMHLVDLAGSERAKRTGAEGARLREAININKGLLALAKVISALVDNQGHVPYRDSKLTRLLQDSLGGNSRTLMLACVSPADVNREESLNTLRYADRARHIKNKPVVNRDPVAAQIAQLRQQLAAMRAENVALKRTIGAAGGDPDALAALLSGTALPPGEALQEAYDELANRCNALEARHACDQAELEDLRGESGDLRERLLAAETARDSARLRLQALRQAAADASHGGALQAAGSDASALAGGAGAAEAAAAGGGAAAGGDAPAGGDADGALLPAAAAGGAAALAAEDGGAEAEAEADVDVVAELRGRISELEAQLRQARSLQRAQSSMLRSTATDGVAAGAAAAAAAAGGRGRGRVGAPAAHRAAGAGRGASAGGAALLVEDAAGSPPASPALRPVEQLNVPLEEADSSKDAELIAGTTAHFVSQEQLKHRLAAIGRQMVAKQRRLAALQSAVATGGAGDGLKAQYDGHLQALQAERDLLLKEKSGLLQKLHKAAEASAEERRRLEALYKDKLATVERRVRDLGDKERDARRGAKQLMRVEQVCKQLQDDICKMKGHKAAVVRRMEQREREFREWRAARERELAQLRRSAQRQSAALQQHQAMHIKQQAVLKRKTEEAEAAKKRLRELMEVQARARIQRTNEAARESMEMQPNAGAPLLRSERARREWVEQEVDLCNTSWEYMKVLEGELAQRAEKTHRLREVQKQLMLLGGMVPPSPVVFSAAAGGGGPGTPFAGGGHGSQEALLHRKQRMEDDIEKHNDAIKELQAQWERARQEEESRGAGAADVRRWTGIRNVIEGRELLRTLFKVASDHKAAVNEAHMELAKLCEEMDILRIMLDTAQQQAGEARRKAVETEATALAVISSTPLSLDRLGLPGGGGGAGPRGGVDRTLADADELIRELGIKMARLSSAADDEAAAEAAAAEAAAAAAAAAGGGARGSLGAGGGGGAPGPRGLATLQLQLHSLEGAWAQLKERPRDAARRSVNGPPSSAGAASAPPPSAAPTAEAPPPPAAAGEEAEGGEAVDKEGIAEIVKELDFGADQGAGAGAAAKAGRRRRPSAGPGLGGGKGEAAGGASSGGEGSSEGYGSYDEEDDEEEEDVEEDEEGEGDSDDDADKDYVPTPAAPRGGRRAARAAAPRAASAWGGGGGIRRGPARARSAGDAGGGEGEGAPLSSACSSSTADGAAAAGGGAAGGAAEGRSAAAARPKLSRAESRQRQMLFQAWTAPVLQHINETRAKNGLAPVHKITVKVLKEALEAAVIEGRRFRPGAMTRDQLIEEYRRLLGLPTDLAPCIATDIDRITGVAQWRTDGVAEEEVIAATAACGGTPSLAGGAPGGASSAGAPGHGAQPAWVPAAAAAPRASRPASAGGTAGAGGGGAGASAPGARPGAALAGPEQCGTPGGSPAAAGARARRRDSTPPDAMRPPARRAGHPFASESMPCSPRDHARAAPGAAAADSPPRGPPPAGGGLSAAARQRSLGRPGAGAAAGLGARRQLSGGVGGEAQVSASLDSAAFRRALREDAEPSPSFLAQGPQRAGQQQQQQQQLTGGGAGRLQHPGIAQLAIPAPFQDGSAAAAAAAGWKAPPGDGAGDGEGGRSAPISARGQGKSVWR